MSGVQNYNRKIKYMDLALVYFIFFNVALLVACIFVAFKYHTYHLALKKKKPITFHTFINRGEEWPSLANVFIGLIFGVIFGFLDNFGLWLGLDHLEKYMPGGLLTKAALGNTYSDMLGVVVGTSISIMAKARYDYEDSNEPIWLNALGILIGCFIGILAGRVFTGRK